MNTLTLKFTESQLCWIASFYLSAANYSNIYFQIKSQIKSGNADELGNYDIVASVDDIMSTVRMLGLASDCYSSSQNKEVRDSMLAQLMAQMPDPGDSPTQEQLPFVRLLMLFKEYRDQCDAVTALQIETTRTALKA